MSLFRSALRLRAFWLAFVVYFGIGLAPAAAQKPDAPPPVSHQRKPPYDPISILKPPGRMSDDMQTPLDAYVAQPDSSYAWSLYNSQHVNGSSPGTGYTIYRINLTSQTWRTTADVNKPVWTHWLILYAPDTLSYTKAFLLIDGGDNSSTPPTSEDSTYGPIAASLQGVLIDLQDVPNQPLLFAGQTTPVTEDDLVAYTWEKYLTTGDPTWPVELPMTKAAVRAMDTVQAFLGSAAGGSRSITDFVVLGASKRGWATWLTAAEDTRVSAIAPIVIDVLNCEINLIHNYDSYGYWNEAFTPYVDAGVIAYIGTPQIEGLWSIIDPYVYLDRFTMPKFVINSTGDQFFVPDSSQFYFADLIGEKHLTYLPNTDHTLDNGTAFLPLAFTVVESLLQNEPRPDFSWTVQPDGEIDVQTVDTPAQVLLWQANDPTARDFRLQTIGPAYTSSPLTDQGDGLYIGQIPTPPQGYSAYFVEVDFPNPLTGINYQFTTDVVVSHPQPVLSSLSPNQAAAGGSDFTLTLNGTNFDRFSCVNWNGVPLTTTYVSFTQLTATVPAADIATINTATVTVTSPAPGGGLSNGLPFGVNTLSISGVITLEGCLNPAQTLAFAFSSNGTLAFTQNVTLDSAGAFTLASIPAGTYTLGIKGAKWLQTDVSVDATNAPITGLTATLLPGDINGDNQIDLRDFNLLAAAFGSSTGSANWNANADLNCDGVVDLKDFNLFAENFGKAGDP